MLFDNEEIIKHFLFYKWQRACFQIISMAIAWQQYNMYSRVHNLHLKCTKFENFLPIIRRVIRPGPLVHFILVYVSQ